MIVGMIICSIQDIKTYTVSVLALLLWIIGSAGCTLLTEVYSGIFIAMPAALILMPYMCWADAVAFCTASSWFQMDDIPLFCISIAACSFGLHKYYVANYKKKEIPMMPAITFGWMLTYFNHGLTQFVEYLYQKSIVIIINICAQVLELCR